MSVWILNLVAPLVDGDINTILYSCSDLIILSPEDNVSASHAKATTLFPSYPLRPQLISAKASWDKITMKIHDNLSFFLYVLISIGYF